MNKSLTDTVNEHTLRVIREAFLSGTMLGIEIGRRILNGTQLSKEESVKETEQAINSLYAKFKITEDKTNEE